MSTSITMTEKVRLFLDTNAVVRQSRLAKAYAEAIEAKVEPKCPDPNCVGDLVNSGDSIHCTVCGN